MTTTRMTIAKIPCPTNKNVIEYFSKGTKIGAVDTTDNSWWNIATGAKRQFASNLLAAEAQLLSAYTR